MKKLVFDTTDAQSILDSDSVGAYLRASDGTLLTHTDVGGKKALDVRVAEGINVEVDLSHVDDSVQIGDGTDILAINADGSINITDNGGSLTVDAVDLDIRDLTQADEITVYQGTSPWVVSATDLDIRDLDAAQDNIASWTHDGAGTAITSTVNGPDTGLDVNIINSSVLVNDAALANTAIANATNTLDVANTAENVVASPLANRKYLFIRNMSNKEMYIGASGVTATNGFPLSPAQIMELRIGAAVDIEFVGRTGETPEIRTLELS
jgi:hypothetical protein